MNTEDNEFNRIEMESKVRQVMQQAVWDSATRVPEGDIRALKHRIHTLEGEVIGYKRILDAQPEQEPVAYTNGTDVILAKYWTADYPPEGWEPLGYTTPPRRTWVGLTDEDCKRMGAGDRVVAMWADRVLKEKNT